MSGGLLGATRERSRAAPTLDVLKDLISLLNVFFVLLLLLPLADEVGQVGEGHVGHHQVPVDRVQHLALARHLGQLEGGHLVVGFLVLDLRDQSLAPLRPAAGVIRALNRIRGVLSRLAFDPRLQREFLRFLQGGGRVGEVIEGGGDRGAILHFDFTELERDSSLAGRALFLAVSLLQELLRRDASLEARLLGNLSA
mgnify:CR=1 FL=1